MKQAQTTERIEKQRLDSDMHEYAALLLAEQVIHGEGRDCPDCGRKTPVKYVGRDGERCGVCGYDYDEI